MKKYAFKNNSLLAVLACFCLIACEHTLVPDPIDPRLPKYTEEGNNVAGAYMNDSIWESKVTLVVLPMVQPYTADEPCFEVWPQNDSLLLRFNGSVAEKAVSLEFHLTGLGISEFKDLTVIEGQKIQLDGIENAGYCIQNFELPDYNKKGVGQIYFKYIGPIGSRINADGETIQTLVISGTFGFWLNPRFDGGETKSVTSGRFDYRINVVDNFKVFD